MLGGRHWPRGMTEEPPGLSAHPQNLLILSFPCSSPCSHAEFTTSATNPFLGLSWPGSRLRGGPGRVSLAGCCGPHPWRGQHPSWWPPAHLATDVSQHFALSPSPSSTPGIASLTSKGSHRFRPPPSGAKLPVTCSWSQHPSQTWAPPPASPASSSRITPQILLALQLPNASSVPTPACRVHGSSAHSPTRQCLLLSQSPLGTHKLCRDKIFLFGGLFWFSLAQGSPVTTPAAPQPLAPAMQHGQG